MTDYSELVSIGDKFGMLTVIDRLPKRIYKSSSKRMWLCRCEEEWGIVKKTRFYLKAVKRLWKHRAEENNRHKWRRMMREVRE